MRITHKLKSHGFIISSILTHASSRTRSLWSSVQQNMPKNIFNFSVKYLNNTLATRKNLSKWSIFQSSACSFCLKLKLFNISSLVVHPTSKRLDTPGVTILSFSISQTLFRHCPHACCMPIYLHFYHQVSLPGILLYQIWY